jgi:putative transposase
VPDWEEFIGEKDEEAEAVLLRRHERSGRPLGSERFLKRLERKLDLELGPKKRGPKGPWKYKK